MSTLIIPIQLRGDTAANWASVNPVLRIDEPGREQDTGKVKIGDGVTAWNALAYAIDPTASGGGEWGTITGTLADQTDLQAALDDKADLVGGLVPTSQIPAIAVTEYLGTVANQAAMLALVGQKGDWAIRSDSGLTYVITGADPTQLADWTALSYPGAPVTSVNGQTGVVVLSAANVGAPAGSGTSTGTNTGDQDLSGYGLKSAANTWVLTQTFTVAPVFTDQSGTRTAMGLGTAAVKNTGTSGDAVPLLNTANTWSAQNTFAAGAITTSQPFTISQTWNAAGVAFEGWVLDLTSTASAAASLAMNIKVGGASIFKLDKAGLITMAGGGVIKDWGSGQIGIGGVGGTIIYMAGSFVGINGNQVYGIGASFGAADVVVGRGGANQFIFGSAAGNQAGAATTRAEMNKAVASIADATPTAVLTITVPNAAHGAQLYIEVCGALGAGGAIGAGEARATNCYTITIARTAGVNAVAAISAASGGGAVAVAGAATVTCTAAVSAVSGAVGAVNTFTVNVTITKSGGASANHTCLVYAKLMNANASGITIA